MSIKMSITNEAFRLKLGYTAEPPEKLIEKVLYVKDFRNYHTPMRGEKARVFSLDWNLYDVMKAELLSLLEK